jgi:hypothetical protein
MLQPLSPAIKCPLFIFPVVFDICRVGLSERLRVHFFVSLSLSKFGLMVTSHHWLQRSISPSSYSVISCVKSWTQQKMWIFGLVWGKVYRTSWCFPCFSYEIWGGSCKFPHTPIQWLNGCFCWNLCSSPICTAFDSTQSRGETAAMSQGNLTPSKGGLAKAVQA